MIDNFIANEFVWNANPDGNIGSCEMIAEKIAYTVHKYYKFEWNEIVTVEVSEDNENGAIIRT